MNMTRMAQVTGVLCSRISSLFFCMYWSPSPTKLEIRYEAKLAAKALMNELKRNSRRPEDIMESVLGFNEILEEAVRDLSVQRSCHYRNLAIMREVALKHIEFEALTADKSLFEQLQSQGIDRDFRELDHLVCSNHVGIPMNEVDMMERDGEYLPQLVEYWAEWDFNGFGRFERIWNYVRNKWEKSLRVPATQLNESDASSESTESGKRKHMRSIRMRSFLEERDEDWCPNTKRRKYA